MYCDECKDQAHSEKANLVAEINRLRETLETIAGISEKSRDALMMSIHGIASFPLNNTKV